MTLPINEIICGSAKPELAKLPAESINCCISSPPYWALRDYGVDGQLGLEPTFEEYIDKLCDIYDEVKRVLRPDGTCFVNLGDTYNNVTPGSRDANRWPKQSRNDHKCDKNISPAVSIKSLCLIPQRFAIEMVNRGWILRNVIIWHKPNPMPSSAKDRFTADFEYVYFFVKSKKYWFGPQYEPHTRDWSGCGGNLAGKGTHKLNDGFKDIGDRTELSPNPLGRNKRTVWTIPTQAEPEAHFATFPDKLVEPMIKSGCPEFVCKKCGKGREKMYETDYISQGQISKNDKSRLGGQGNNFATRKQGRASAEHHFKGYTDCGCGENWRPGIVLDPFAGTCTVAKVAARLQRDYIMIELKKEYIDGIAISKVKAIETGVPVREHKIGQMPLF